jgi:Tautomerase enzyme
MPFVTFTVRRGLSTADKFHLSAAMIEAQVVAGFPRDDRFHRFLEVDHGNLLADPRFPDYATDRTDRFIVVEVIISKGRPTGTAAMLAEEAVRQFGERLHLAPQDACLSSKKWNRISRAFPLNRSTKRRLPMPKPSKRDHLVEITKDLLWEVGYEAVSSRDIQARSAARPATGRREASDKFRCLATAVK